MKNKKTVVVGLSGGVDSSVTTLLLKKQGYNVIGVFMQNWDPVANSELNHLQLNENCEASYDFLDAQTVAQKLNIPLYKKDFIKEYWNQVFLEFIDKYKSGSTPNPDILCNKYIKFDAFIRYAKATFNCDYIATGHYAKVTHKKGQSFLKLCKDKNKDQTYFLSQLTNQQLNNVLFPLANLTKPQVRKIAQKHHLVTANKKDSTGICFIGERNLVNFLSNYIPKKKGEIIDITTNKVVGAHEGSSFYTIGQRKGLNLSGMSEKYFVCKKVNNTIYVAPNRLEKVYLQVNCAQLTNLNILKQFKNKSTLYARFRHRQKLQKVKVYKAYNELYVVFKAQKNIVKGQYCVLYKNNYCLGAGEINETYNIRIKS